MTYTDAFSKLSTTLDHFNNTLKETDKLDEKALKTIQNYFNDATVMVLKQEDGSKLQRALKQLELLNDQVTLDRVKLIDMKEINRQIIRLAQMINKKPEQTKKNACFTIIKLEVCFLKILSEEAGDGSKKWRNLYEEKMNVKATSGPSGSTSYARAKRTKEQQYVVNELMNAVLTDIIACFKARDESFTDQFTEAFLDLLEEKIKNPDQPAKNETINDVKETLMKTAAICEWGIDYLILQLRYAVIELNERVNPYSIPLLQYITNTTSPRLQGFNQTLDFPAALSSEEVEKFEPLFQLYCKDLLEPSSAATTDASTVKPEKSIKLDLPAPPKINDASDLKFIWIEPNIEDHYAAYYTIIKPGMSTRCNADEFRSQISNEWIGSRIFLCVSATQTNDLLSSIHEKQELYCVYVLCHNQAEEDDIKKETEKFNKIRITTSKQEEFIERLAVDIVPSLIEAADIHFGNNKTDAKRWYTQSLKKVEKYGDDSLKNSFMPILDEKIKKCSQ